MTAHARQRQQIGLHACAAGRIGSGERENERRIGGIGVAGHHGALAFAKAARALGRDCYTSNSTLRTLRTVRAQSPASPMKKYMCLICGWIYDEAVGSPEDGIAPGTRWEDVPPNWTCPECGARKEDFEMVEF
jgi:rubredoxin